MTKRREFVAKKCDRCGAVRKQCTRAERACFKSERNAKGFTTGYRCPGTMRTIVRKRKKPATAIPIPKGVGLGYVLSEEYQAQLLAQRGAAGRAKSTNELDKIRGKLKEWRSEQKRIGNLVKKWEKLERRHESRSTWTDAQFAEERQRAEKAAKVSRVKRRISKAAGVDDVEEA